MLHFYSGCCCKARLDLDFLCLGGFVSSILMKVIPVSPTDKPGSPCPCFSCAVLGQLPSFRGQEADLEAESGDPEPPKAAAALPGECAVFPCWDGLGPPDWAAVGGGLCGGVSALTVLFLWWNLSTLSYFCPSCSWRRVEMSRARLWLCRPVEKKTGWPKCKLGKHLREPETKRRAALARASH